MLFIRSVLLASIFILNPLPLLASDATKPEIWRFSLGVGGLLAPEFTGSDQYRLAILPAFSASYGDRFFASVIEGVGYNLLHSEPWRLALISKYNWGRKEDGKSPFYVDNRSSNDLAGLGDVDGSFEFGGFVEYSGDRFVSKVEIRKSVDSQQGLIAEAEYKFKGKLQLMGHGTLYSIGPKVTFADEDYINAYFGVNNQQSLASGLDEFEYRAGNDDVFSGLNVSALTYGLHSSLVVILNRSVSVVGFAGIDRIASDVAKSPLIATRGTKDQAKLGVFLNYAFK